MNKYTRRRQAEPAILEQLNGTRRKGIGKNTLFREDLGLPTVEDEIVSSQAGSITPIPQAYPMAKHNQSKTVEIVRGTQTHRAEAFRIKFAPIANITGISIGALAFIGWTVTRGLSGMGLVGFGILIAVAVLAGLGAFMLVWLVALTIDTLTSPGFIGLFESVQEQRRLNQDAKTMRENYRRKEGLDR